MGRKDRYTPTTDLTSDDMRVLVETVAADRVLQDAALELERELKDGHGVKAFGAASSAEVIYCIGKWLAKRTKEAERENRVRRQWVSDLQARGVQRYG